MFPDNGCLRQILSLKILCKRSGDGCVLIGSLSKAEVRDYVSHLLASRKYIRCALLGRLWTTTFDIYMRFTSNKLSTWFLATYQIRLDPVLSRPHNISMALLKN